MSTVDDDKPGNAPERIKSSFKKSINLVLMFFDNLDCPGTTSEQAGKAEACAGCPNQNICATTPKGPDPDLERITENLTNVKHVILILSGKGGVGKSTVTAQLGRALAHNPDLQVGILDVDICGPSQPQMLGVLDETLHPSQFGLAPVITGVNENLVIVSVGFLLEWEDDAVIWRGPKKNALIKQFLRDVQWESLDYLLVDTPPGTSDEHLALVQLIKPVTGAILVTTPQEVAWQDVRKEIDFCHKTKIPILGIVENMSGYVCRKCHKPSEIFTGDAVHRYCEATNIPVLATIPLDPTIGISCDDGIDLSANDQVNTIYLDMAKRVVQLTASLVRIPVE